MVGFVPPGYGPVDFYTSHKVHFILFSKIRSCKPGCTPASPAAFSAQLPVFDETLAQPDFVVVNCSDVVNECFTPYFNAQLDIFAVMNCCVVALS